MSAVMLTGCGGNGGGQAQGVQEPTATVAEGKEYPYTEKSSYMIYYGDHKRGKTV